jgi:hypothetical protein
MALTKRACNAGPYVINEVKNCAFVYRFSMIFAVNSFLINIAL